MIQKRFLNVAIRSLVKNVRICSYSSTQDVTLRAPLKTVDLAYASTENTEHPSEEVTPLIILHGLLGSKNNWNSISKALHRETGRKIVRVDARNHGDSGKASEHTYLHMAQDVVELMKKLSINEAVIMGHSMGGRTAMVMSLVYPEYVSRLIVADISPVTTSPAIHTMHYMFETMEKISIEAALPLSQARKQADDQLKMVIKDESVRNFILTNLVRRDNGTYEWKCNLKALKANFRNHIAMFPEKLQGMQYSGPTMFIGGMESDYIGKKDLPKIRDIFPKAELHFIPGAGHWLHAEKPQDFINIVTDFLNE